MTLRSGLQGPCIATLRRSQKLLQAIQEEAADTFPAGILEIAEAGTRQFGIIAVLILKSGL